MMAQDFKWFYAGKFYGSKFDAGAGYRNHTRDGQKIDEDKGFIGKQL